MPAREVVTLTEDEIDDLLYLTRANEGNELKQQFAELGQKYNCAQSDLVVAAVDPISGNTLLHYASANGFADLTQDIILHHDRNATAINGVPTTNVAHPSVNAVNSQGNTPLHWASLNGHLNVVKILLEAGADASIKNAAGHLPIFEAERAGKGLVVEYLLDKMGPDLSPEDLAEALEEDLNVSSGAQDVSEGEEQSAVHTANGMQSLDAALQSTFERT